MVPMGHVIGPFGILGWVKIAHYTDHLENLLDYPVWWLGKQSEDTWKAMNVVSYNIHDNRLTVSFEECRDRTQASQLKGMQIAVPRNQLPALPETGEEGYYWSDLIGMNVLNLQHEEFGSVIGLLRTGANDVLQVRSMKEDQQERLVPFIDQVIVEVDLKTRKIIIDWGLDY
ncbi:MAG: ribosome maturation factor RimM [Nitrosomonas sp.]|nr:ribosome maturation factor RimM [Nitrosomonas sp.]MCW5599627.1 ribosome maturation factor RimM [Nitrosomonas sp.]MCW5601325.1 ribosome maturation factor RimM [Nitrosomonas sp.]